MSATTTVCLSDEDRQLLARLVPEYGDQSNAIRQGIRRLAHEQEQREMLRSLLHDWEAESGPVDEDMVAEMRRQYYGQWSWTQACSSPSTAARHGFAHA